MNSATITSWLLTYLIHSTALLGLAWLVARLLGSRQLALQEVLLRTALIGGLLTATLQVGFGIQPVGGALAVTDLSQTEIISAGTMSDVVANDFALSPAPAPSSRTPASWPMALISIWALGLMLALLTLGRSILDLRRLLKTRRFRPAGRLLERLSTAMGMRRTVRLSTTAAIAVPFATGIRKPEICCPERVGDLAFEHQKSLFAHELAHLARRDPAWQLFYRIGEALLFLQPLNRIVRRRLEEIAEHLTDERAVACTGDRLGLARCLVVVALWGISDAPGVPATAFAAGPRLDRRVRHLLSGAVGQNRVARWTAPLLALLVVGSVLLLPAIATSTVHADISRTGSDAVPAQTWSTLTDAPDAEQPTAPAPPAVPVSSIVPQQVEPVTDVAPAPDVLPLSPTARGPVSAPAPAVEPSLATAPDPNTAPAPPYPPAAPEPPSKTDKAHPEKPRESERGKARAEARDRQRSAQREQSEAEKEARERARAFAAQAREMAREAAERSRFTEAQRDEMRRRFEEFQARSREPAREATERSRLTEAERQKLWDETRELRMQAQAEAREYSRLAAERLRLTDAEREKLWAEVSELRKKSEVEAREHMRRAREQMQISEAEREEMMRRIAELHAESRALAFESAREAREKSRELAERARRLAEEAEAERQIEEERRRRERPE